MATENPRVWFKSISLENVRSFGEKQTINFTNKDGNAARWNVILGDNGTGKTTVLKGLCIVQTSFNDFVVSDIRSHYSSMVRNNDQSVDFETVYDVEGKYLPKFSTSIKYHNKSKKRFESWQGEAYSQWYVTLENLLIFAYGAARKMGESSISKEQNKYSANSLFDERIGLINAEELLIQADYYALKNEKFYASKNRIILKLLLTLLHGEVKDIYTDLDPTIQFPKVYFETVYGKVRLHELSLGYKTLIAWMVDFAKGLLDRFPNSPDPLAEPAVCLVDEIDLHLHPKFQRTIIKFLTETFPNTQFIVTAHSPLIVVAAEERPLDANIILLKREGDHTVVVNDPVDVSKWSVDQILNSDLFGHVPAQSENLTKLRAERDTLLTKAKLTKKDNTRLAELDEQIGFVPFGNDQTEIQAETIIQQLADVLRKQQQVQ